MNQFHFFTRNTVTGEHDVYKCVAPKGTSNDDAFDILARTVDFNEVVERVEVSDFDLV